MPSDLLLVHGGRWEDMDAARFWLETGIAGGLTRLGFSVLTPDRLERAGGALSEITKDLILM